MHEKCKELTREKIFHPRFTLTVANISCVRTILSVVTIFADEEGEFWQQQGESGHIAEHEGEGGHVADEGGGGHIAEHHQMQKKHLAHL